MSTTQAPGSVAELVEVVRGLPRVLAVGAETKPRLSAVDATRISTLRLRGIVEYEPSEFTFTAMAGTPLREIIETVAQRGQYLPFDPLLVEAGATLGGTVAAGLNGPGRLRFGGIKDFILGTQFVDGLGRALRVGGKVVKNAAGFDLPKFLVGSLGRFGVLTELTFKVFPTLVSTLTLKLAAKDIDTSVRILLESAKARWEVQALDIPPGCCDVYLRLAGPAQALQEVAHDVFLRWPGEKLSPADAGSVWSGLCEFRWAHPDGSLIKIALTPTVLPALYRAVQRFEGLRIHVSSGGNMAFISIPTGKDASELNELLRNLVISGVTLRGEAPLWCGFQPRTEIMQRVKHALDPENRFPGVNEDSTK